MSPIRDPESPAARRLTRLASRMDQKPGADGAPRRHRPRDDARDTGDDRPHFDPESALDGELDDLPTRQKHNRHRAPSGRSRQAGETRVPDTPAGQPQPADPADTVVGLVVATTRGPYEVELDDGTLALAHLPKKLARANRSLVAVGDRVRLALRPSGEWVVEGVEARRTKLSRPDPLLPHIERVLAANVDLAVIVVSLRSPPFSPGLVDRFLVALRHGGVAALIAVNKIDLAPESVAGGLDEDPLASLRDLGVAIVRCSARTEEGLEELRARIAGQTVVFVGHSGVGKSSLLNALLPGADARVGAVAANRRRGRHTTSRSRIYRLADDTRIIDTPGIREFGLWQMTGRELALYFDDFAPFAVNCRFSNCSHRHEPACAVGAAAQSGELAPERLAIYLRILESLEHG